VGTELARGSAVSSTAENCGRPTAVIMRVVHIAPGPTPTLMMSAPAATRSRTPSAVTTLPATRRDAQVEVLDGREARGASLLMAVRGVEHEHVDARLDEGRGLGGDVAVDADRGGDAQATVASTPAVERRPQRAAAAQGADDRRRAAARGEVEARVHHQVERRPGPSRSSASRAVTELCTRSPSGRREARSRGATRERIRAPRPKRERSTIP
jgi:hypothetical protein